MPVARARIWATLWAVCGALAAGCGTYRVDRDVDERALEEVRVTPTLALVPPRLLTAHAPYQVFQVASDVADVLAVEGGLPVLAPWEYDPQGTLSEPNELDRLLLVLASEPALVGRNVLVVQVVVEESATSRDMRAPLAQGGEIEREHESQVEVVVTADTFPRGERVAQVTVAFEDPPFHEAATPANPRPVLREGIREAARALADVLADDWLAPAPGAPPDLDVTVNPGRVFEYAGGGVPLSQALAHLDELDRMAQSLVYYQYFEPELDGATLRLFQGQTEGLLVNGAAGEAAEAGLRAGDYIVSVAGYPAAGVQAWIRPFAQRSPGETVRVAVLREGALVELEVPVVAR